MPAREPEDRRFTAYIGCFFASVVLGVLTFLVSSVWVSFYRATVYGATLFLVVFIGGCLAIWILISD